MNTIEIKGVLYKKSSVIAKEFGYTTDYVGQLCRGGKVRSEMVGRSWYVDPASVIEYQEQKYEVSDVDPLPESKAAAGAATNKTLGQGKQSIDIKRVTKEMEKKEMSIPTVNPGRQIAHLRYESDETDLFPSWQRVTGDDDNRNYIAINIVTEPALETKNVPEVTIVSAGPDDKAYVSFDDMAKNMDISPAISKKIKKTETIITLDRRKTKTQPRLKKRIAAAPKQKITTQSQQTRQRKAIKPMVLILFLCFCTFVLGFVLVSVRQFSYEQGEAVVADRFNFDFSEFAVFKEVSSFDLSTFFNK